MAFSLVILHAAGKLAGEIDALSRDQRGRRGGLPGPSFDAVVYEAAAYAHYQLISGTFRLYGKSGVHHAPAENPWLPALRDSVGVTADLLRSETDWAIDRTGFVERLGEHGESAGVSERREMERFALLVAASAQLGRPVPSRASVSVGVAPGDVVEACVATFHRVHLPELQEHVRQLRTQHDALHLSS